MREYLITGVQRGLGQHLWHSLPDSAGLDRTNFDVIKQDSYKTIIHCAFNKENPVINHRKYIEDNIFLIQKLKKLKYKKFVYISSVDVYQENPTIYALFKRFAESLLDPGDLILRCPMLLGATSKPNHITKMWRNEPKIGLSGESTFSYVLMDDIAKFFKSGDYMGYSGVIDFVSTDVAKLSDVKNQLKSTTELGSYVYTNDIDTYSRPIYTVTNKYNHTAFENLKRYL